MAKSKQAPKAKAKDTKVDAPTKDETPVEEGKVEAPKDEAPKEETPPAATEPKEPAAANHEPKEPTPSKDEGEEKTVELPQGGRNVYDAIVAYVGSMGPAHPQTEQSIQQNQRRLKTAVDTLLRLPVDEFGPTLKAVVALIGENREAAFNERYLFRGFPSLRLPSKDRTRFELVLSLLTTASDVKSFSEVKKHVSLDTLFKYVTDNDQQQKLAGVFK